MPNKASSVVGKRGAVIIPVEMRRHLGLEEGTPIIAEEREGGIFIRPAVLLPVEVYAPERKAEFLLSNAVDEEDYRQAREDVRKMGLDPDTIAHYRLVVR